MKKVDKKSEAKSKVKKVAAKAIKPAQVEESMVHNTKGAEMPNPAERNRPLRKDVRFAFR